MLRHYVHREVSGPKDHSKKSVQKWTKVWEMQKIRKCGKYENVEKCRKKCTKLYISLQKCGKYACIKDQGEQLLTTNQAHHDYLIIIPKNDTITKLTNEQTTLSHSFFPTGSHTHFPDKGAFPGHVTTLSNKLTTDEHTTDKQFRRITSPKHETDGHSDCHTRDKQFRRITSPKQ